MGNSSWRCYLGRASEIKKSLCKSPLTDVAFATADCVLVYSTNVLISRENAS
jgi:hypothetical protein